MNIRPLGDKVVVKAQTQEEKTAGGIVLPENPVYPENYQPSLLSDSIFDTDTSLGFSGGDVFPFVQGSRFRIFDN